MECYLISLDEIIYDPEGPIINGLAVLFAELMAEWMLAREHRDPILTTSILFRAIEADRKEPYTYVIEKGASHRDF
ncbi:MAG: hypothetical protein COB04_07170 [Gammaproteobacteria bacterium]|nr:MAG: hypothetical protein COB04_07170 [Gammaproteobacteria bacterium]